MTDPVRICNQALGWLGANPITSLNDNTTNARLCAANYDPLRQALLEEYVWGFATRRYVLEAQTAPNENQWGDGYKWFPLEDPTDVLYVHGVWDNPDGKNQLRDWSIEETNLVVRAELTDKVYIIVVIDAQDTRQFTANFSQALAARLAADLAITVTENRQLQADLWALYDQKIENAQVLDANQRSPHYNDYSKLVNARGFNQWTGNPSN